MPRIAPYRPKNTPWNGGHVENPERETDSYDRPGAGALARGRARRRLEDLADEKAITDELDPFAGLGES